MLGLSEDETDLMRNWRCISTESGATLLEVIIATLLVTGAVVALALYLPKAIDAFTRARARNFANATANSVLQSVKTKPYPLVPLTPANVPLHTIFLPSPSAPCACNSCD